MAERDESPRGARSCARSARCTTRPLAQPVDGLEVPGHQQAGARWGRVEPVDIDVLAAVVRADAHDVALVRDYVEELVLATEPAQRIGRTNAMSAGAGGGGA